MQRASRSFTVAVALLAFMFTGCEKPKSDAGTAQNSNASYSFERGFPVGDSAQKGYDDTDLNTAITAYKFFYPSVSMMGTWEGNIAVGSITNKSFVLMNGSPHQVVFTPNSDTPYSGANIDLSQGPMVVESPAGFIMARRTT